MGYKKIKTLRPSVAPKVENLLGQWSRIIRNYQEKRSSRQLLPPENVMITIFWDTDGVILVDVMARGETISSNAYIKTLQELKELYRRVRPNRNPRDILIQHDNVRPHTSLETQETIAKFGWNVFPHPPPPSPDLAPSIFIVLGH
jgi:hypothetical protein